MDATKDENEKPTTAATRSSGDLIVMFTNLVDLTMNAGTHRLNVTRRKGRL